MQQQSGTTEVQGRHRTLNWHLYYRQIDDRFIYSAQRLWLKLSSNQLRMNSNKTQLIWLGTKQQLDKQSMTELDLLSAGVRFSTAVSDLGVLVDSQLSMADHVPQCHARGWFNCVNFVYCGAVVTERGNREDTRARVCQQPSWLLQQPAVRCQQRVAAEVTGHSECGRTSGDGSEEVQSYYLCASWTSLAAHPPTQ